MRRDHRRGIRCIAGPSHRSLSVSPNTNGVRIMSETTIEPALLISGESALTVDQLAALSGSDTAAARAVGLTVRQRSSGRFLDAHENSANDFRLVTRPPQNNTSQRWQLMLAGYLVTARQKVNGRFLDAYESDANGFRLVTRPGQDND